jgi:branched-chain amino acid transport system ATP-binding protein
MKSPSAPLLELNDVVVRYGGVAAVDGVSFELEPGSIYGLVGPNGSGKSTLLAAVAGTRAADDGSIRLDGEETRRRRPWQLAAAGVARTFQGTRLVDGMSVRDNVLLGCEWGLKGRAQSRGSARSRAEEAMDICDLLDVSNAQPSSLSYGRQRLVEIARAIAAGARLLLLDEPVAGMNREERNEVERVQMDLRARGVTQLLVEHNMHMVARLCREVFVLNSGKLIARGTAAEIADDPVVRDAYLGRRHDGVGVAGR